MTTAYDITPAFEIACYILTSLFIILMTARPKTVRQPQQVFPTLTPEITTQTIEQSAVTAFIEPPSLSTPSTTRKPRSKSRNKSMQSTPSITSIKVQEPLSGNPKLNSHQLRKLCSEYGIKWRNYHAKDKHMSTAQMREELTKITGIQY